MKKFLPIILIIALVAVIFCFAACGDDTIDDTLTSMSNEMTSIMDDMTSQPDTTDNSLFDDATDNTGSSGADNNTNDVTGGPTGTSDTTEGNLGSTAE